MTLPPYPPPNATFEQRERMMRARIEAKERFLENVAAHSYPFTISNDEPALWCDGDVGDQDGNLCRSKWDGHVFGYYCDQPSWFDYFAGAECIYGENENTYIGPCVNPDGKTLEFHPCASTGMFYANKNYGIFEGSMGVVAEETDRAVYDGKVKFLQAMGDVYVRAGAVAGAMIATRLAFINAMGDAQREATSFPVNFPPIVPPPPLT